MEESRTRECMEADITHIREWLSKQPHLNSRTDDRWILIFLRGCKFKLSSVKEKLDNYYTTKASLSDVYLSRNPFLPEIQEILNLGLFLPLCNENNQQTIFFCRADKADPSKHTVPTIMKLFVMIVEIVMFEHNHMTSDGDTLLIDMQKLNLQYITQLTPSVIKNAITCFKDSYPIRHKAMYLINVPTGIETTINLIKLLLGKKLSERIHVSSTKNNENIYSIVRDVLPKDYGGNGSSLDDLTVKWKRKVESYQGWFAKDEKYVVDESKRIRTSNDVDIFGVEGSFRALAVD